MTSPLSKSLSSAVENDDLNEARAILSTDEGVRAASKTRDSGMAPVMKLLSSGSLDMFKLFQDMGVKIREKYKVGYANLYSISLILEQKKNRSDWLPIVEVLLKKYGTSQPPDHFKMDFLGHAVKADWLEAAELFLKRGISPNGKCVMGAYVIPTLSLARSEKMVVLLHAYGANLEDLDDYGDSALVKAIRMGRREVISSLLSCGSSLYTEKNPASKVDEIATRNGVMDILMAWKESSLLSDESKIGMIKPRGRL